MFTRLSDLHCSKALLYSVISVTEVPGAQGDDPVLGELFKELKSLKTILTKNYLVSEQFSGLHFYHAVRTMTVI